MERNSFFAVLTTAIVVLASLQTARTSSLTPWPYLQIYPPVNESDGRTPLYFALMLSFGGQFTSVGALPGVQIALDYINSHPDILPGYSLHYTLTDSQVRGMLYQIMQSLRASCATSCCTEPLKFIIAFCIEKHLVLMN